MSGLDKKPLVGFFPLSHNLAEMGRAILVAKEYIALGGKAVIFTHAGEYEHLAEDFGFNAVRIKPFYTEKIVKEIVSINRGEKKGIPYKESFLREAVQEEIAAYKKTGVKMIVSFVNFPCSISARVAGIPLVWVSPAPGTFYLSTPDYYENAFTRLIPRSLKIWLFNWFFNHSKKFLKPFNTIAKEHSLKPFKSTAEVMFGNVTLATNFLEFVNIFPNQQRHPAEDYVGIILLEKLFKDMFPTKDKQKINEEIKKHLDTTNKSILLAMGSSGDKTLFLKILHALNKTPHNVIAVYGKILKENEIPKLNDNILLKKFVPSTKELHKMVDLSIIHGGQGTVYTAAYAGKPIIGFPMQFEQHLNLEKMVGHGTGLMLSKKYFKEGDLVNTIQKIFDNYDIYLKNAQTLAQKLPKPKGEKNAARRIVEILNILL
jgi:UDP:flavonoid glycosyltransferase YjiC (YdhE family)